MRYDRKALKLEAKTLIRGTRPRAWQVTLVFLLLATALPNLIRGFINPVGALMPQVMEDIAEMARRGQEPDAIWAASVAGPMVGGGLLMIFVTVLMALFTTVMSYGYLGWALRVFRRQKAGMGSIFSGFPVAGQVIGTYLMSYIFVWLWTLLATMVFSLALSLGTWLFGSVLGLEVLGVLWIAVTTVGYVVVLWMIALRYCLAPYYVMNEPGMGVFDAIRASKTTMRGNYGKKFVLDLSFLGWGLLVLLIFLVVAVIGVSVVLLTVGGNWLMELGRVAQFVTSEQELEMWMMDNLSELMESVVGPMGLAFLAGWLATLPLLLWLRAYQEVADAGFFLTVTGQAVLMEDGTEDPYRVVSPDAPDSPKCANCGAVLTPGTAFCVQCGAPVSQPAPAEEPLVEDVPAEETPIQSFTVEESPTEESPAEEPPTEESPEEPPTEE